MGFVKSAFKGVTNFVDSIFDPGDDAKRASERAYGAQAEWQQKALDYMMERERLPQQFREGALGELAGMYGLEGGTGSQAAAIEEARKSPLFQAIMGGRQSGEDAILRAASATGGLRSGNVQEALYDYNTQLENRALLESYNQRVAGLGGLASLPSMTPQIAGQMSGIGQTYGQGIVGAHQSLAAGQQSAFDNILGIGKIAAGMKF